MENENDAKNESPSSKPIHESGSCSDSSSLERALEFTRNDPDAVVLSLWPSALQVSSNNNNNEPEQIRVARNYLETNGATIVHEQSIQVSSENANLPLLLVMASYWGEDWLRTNCWYGEQPLEELGLPPPTGSWPGAKWKKELCFRQHDRETKNNITNQSDFRMHVFVARVSANKNRNQLWANKYSIRANMARDTGHAGNSCMHLTDDQRDMVKESNNNNGNSAWQQAGGGLGSMDCNASYAFSCARLLLNPTSLQVLSILAQGFPNDKDLATPSFCEMFGGFCNWLGDRNVRDVKTGTNEWNRPPPMTLNK